MYTLKIGKYIASYVGTWDYILFIFCVCACYPSIPVPNTKFPHILSGRIIKHGNVCMKHYPDDNSNSPKIK